MKWSTLQQHKEAVMLCEEGMLITKVRSALLVPQSIKHVAPTKTYNNTGKINKHCTNCGMMNHNVETCKKERAYYGDNHKGNIIKSKTIEDIFICMSHLWFEWT